jgi:hypothetical protein
MNKLLGMQASLPSRKLRIALICEEEIIKANLLYESCAMEYVPNLFGKP